MLRYEFDVTQEDIDEGVPKNKNHCMIARALEREFGRSTRVGTLMSNLECNRGSSNTIIAHSLGIQNRIRVFDSNRSSVVPFTAVITEEGASFKMDVKN